MQIEISPAQKLKLSKEKSVFEPPPQKFNPPRLPDQSQVSTHAPSTNIDASWLSKSTAISIAIFPPVL